MFPKTPLISCRLFAQEVFKYRESLKEIKAPTGERSSRSLGLDRTVKRDRQAVTVFAGV